MNRTITQKALHSLCFILFLACFFTVSSYAQTSRITGVIRSTEGETLPGVNVKVKGSNNGTITDGSGSFSIDAKAGDVLSLSYIGFLTKEVTVGQTANLGNIQLATDNVTLQEVAVVSIGYGTTTKRDLTGAVSSVRAADIKQGSLATFDQALQGRAAGVVVNTNSGQPGGGVSIQIRGVATLGGAEPLYVVDGIFYGGDDNGRIYTGGTPVTNPLASLNPSDIESVDILKDASATAIYGSRGSNGVVIVTTKRGAAGAPKLNFDASYGVQQLPYYMPVMNLQEFAIFRNERVRMIGGTYTPEFADPSVLGEGTNWQKEIFNDAPVQNYNLNLSGGDDRNKYLISAGYFDQDGIATNSNFKRYSSRINFDNKTLSWLKLGTSVSMARVTENINNQSGNLISFAIRQSPDIAARNGDGTYGGPYDANFPLSGGNPLAIAEISLNQRKRNEFYGNFYSDILFSKDLTLRSEVNGNFNSGNIYTFTPTYKFGVVENLVSSATRGNTNGTGLTYRNYLSYVHTFAQKLDVNATAGHEATSSVYEYVNAGASNLLTNNISELNQGDATKATSSSGKGHYAIESYFARFNLSFDNRYLLTATVRNDGSSNFAQDKRWNFNSAFGFAWRVSEESFMKESNVNLKVRLGYGTLNNQNIDSYAYGSKLSTVQTGNFGTTVLISNLANPDLTWEKTQTSNVGIDLGLFKDRIRLTADAYLKKTEGLLQTLPLALYSGTSVGYATGALGAPAYNLGAIDNKGFEFTLTTDNIKTKDFNWNTTLTLSRNKNKVTGLVTNNTIIPTYIGTTIVAQTSVGNSIAEFYGYEMDGIYKDAADLQNSPRPSGSNGEILPVNPENVWIGDVKFKDRDGNGIIDEKDRTYLGSPMPKFQFGINNAFRYKAFELTLFFNGNYGNKIFNNLKRENEDPGSNFGMLKSVADFARIGLLDPAGSATDVNNVYLINEGTTVPRVTNANVNNNGRPSTRFIEDGSYIRLKSAVLGYNLPWNLIQKAKLSYLKVFTNVNNVFTITNYTGYDPEVGSASQSALSAGIDYGRYPSSRTFTLGLSAGF
ncbi:MAG: TonB-dependent receptor [Pedobacter sp.]|nr:MAG: TonB-dependent receptor [Pedobacter sp.]